MGTVGAYCHTALLFALVSTCIVVGAPQAESLVREHTRDSNSLGHEGEEQLELPAAREPSITDGLFGHQFDGPESEETGDEQQVAVDHDNQLGNSFASEQNEGPTGTDASTGAVAQDQHQQRQPVQQVEKQEELGSLFGLGKFLQGDSIGNVELKTGEKINFFDHFLLDTVPKILHSKPANENGTLSKYRDFALADTSNDDAARLTGVSLGCKLPVPVLCKYLSS